MSTTLEGLPKSFRIEGGWGWETGLSKEFRDGGPELRF